MNILKAPSLVILLVMLLSACTTSPPRNTDNICEIFYEKDGWYKDARAAQRRWGAPIPVMMAFIHQESRFEAKAKPPRKKILWVIPGRRPASAYGYSQAIKPTWAAYKKSTGSWGADRNKFEDAIDFIGWYIDQSARKNRIKKRDAYHLYLAYHEGQGGFEKRTYRKKTWLINVAKKVSKRSATYTKQLKGCEKRLKRGWLGKLFFGG